MKVLLSILLIIPTWAISQRIDNCIADQIYLVKAESGMKMRSGPGTNNQVVVFVPSRTFLLVCKETSTPATFENEPGHWRRVRYKNNYGYMFDGFLEKAPSNFYLNDTTWDIVELPVVQRIIDTAHSNETPDTLQIDSVKTIESMVEIEDSVNTKDSLVVMETMTDSALIETLNIDSLHQQWNGDTLFLDSLKVYVKDSITLDTLPYTDPLSLIPPEPDYQFTVETFNYCGPIDHLDPGLRWYGVFYENENYRIREIELLIVRSKYSLGSGVEFDIRSEDGIPPHFMIGSNKRINTLWHVSFPEDYFLGHPDMIYPGQKANIYSNDNISDGYNFTLFATGAVSDVGLCPVFDEYRIKITGEMHDKLITQDITDSIAFLGECGIPKLYWFGDLNQDKYPDFIFAGQGKDKTSFTLFMSDIRNKEVLVKKISEWSYSKCD